MSDEKLQCPKCIGMMELQPLEHGPAFVCFVCRHRISLAEHQDSKRWWGNWHLPLIDLFIHPHQALLQMCSHPAPLPSLVFYLVSDILANRATSNPSLRGISLPASTMLYVWPAIFFVEQTVFAWVLHNLAKWMGGRGRFRVFWPISLFLCAVFNFLGLIPMHLPALAWWVVSWGYTGYALWVVYRFDSFDAVMAMVLGLALRSVYWRLIPLMLGISSMGGLKYGLRIPGRAAHASLTRVHQRADFNVTFHRMDGSALPLSQVRGKVIFLNFWATWCFPCRMEMDSIQRLFNQFKEDPRVVFIVATDEGPVKIQQFLAKNKYSLPFYRYSGELPQAYAHDALPTTYVLSPDGEIVGVRQGATRWDSAGNIEFIRTLLQVHADTSK